MPVPSPSWRNVGYSTTHLSFHLDFAPIFQRRPFSSVGVAKELDKHSFTVSYLINSCGLSPASAKSASKLVQFRDSAKQDRLLNCLRSHGFTDAHILKVVRIQPIVLLLDAEKTVLPKFEFFHSIGISGAELANLISRNPTLLACSLNHKIIPCYNFLKSQLVHNEVVVKSFKNTTRILLERVEKNVCPNISILKGVGVSDSNIQRLLMWASESLCLDTSKFNEKVKTIIDMGFDPSRYLFFDAIRFWPTKTTWQLKAELYRSWGWSEDEFLSAFKKDPSFLGKSAKKVTSVMDFLVNKMGWHPSAVARVPYVLSFSLKKRIIPRCSVIRFLLLKGLIKEEIFLSSVMMSPEKYYLDRFVFRYKEKAPQLLDILQGKLDLLELGLSFEEKLNTKLN
ncbi:hypothetical protein SLEP1_g23293 [Rubroshorea leprosula]|uniref:Uncharacterized protein n=1 Tax=Rubroshorea leprosula TaxID=152421 RepID=A0AAV5JBY6_9ROSI|nr:hypothetical protein SLEP1_g23293 [Rubroshorea leprosula]